MECAEYLDVQTRRGARRFVLAREPLAIGRSAENDIALADDSSVSRGHALLEHVPAGWVLTDLGSRNGTSVNGRRIWSKHLLHTGDEIRIGTARLTYRRAPSEPRDDTIGPERTPDLTRREREVLVELCRPALGGDVFTEPASIREIARRLFVTEAAVKQHLGRLYDKFAIRDEGERRRVRLANEAVRRCIVTLADLGEGSAEQTPAVTATGSPARTTRDG